MSPTVCASIRSASRCVNVFDVPRRTRTHSRVIWTMSVGRAPGSEKVGPGGLERDVRVVIGVLSRVLEPEERRVAVLVKRVLDCVGPNSGIGERFLRPENLPDFVQRARALQMKLGHATDDAVTGVPEGAKRGPQCRDSGDAKQ